MPMYDFLCPNGHEFDAYRPVGTQSASCPDCSCDSPKVWISHPPSVIGDECDIIQENGFRHPQRFTSMSERRRALKEAGMSEMVRHVGVPGTDKSPHTSSWSAIGPGTLESAKAMLERVGSTRRDPTEDEVDDAVSVGDIAVPVVTTSDGRTLGVHVGKVYSGVINPDDM